MLVHLTTPDLTTTTISFEQLVSKTPFTILYFYPKDDTPGCTIEAKEFTELLPEFIKAGAQVIGASKDNQTSHCAFVTKHGLQIPLISDETLELHRYFDTRGERSMWGKIFLGTIRSTILLDASGTVLRERKNVSAKGHAKELLDYVLLLKTSTHSL